MDVSELFWNASLEEFKRGYIEEDEQYKCLLCGKGIEKGIVYPKDDVLYEAERYMRIHVKETHGSVFEYLIQLNKKLTGLTDHQNSLLKLFYQGKSDREVQQELEIGSSSTIRNHRFVLKEKERQAKVFLTLMELLKERDKHAPTFIDVHQTATMVDDRYNVTEDERMEVINKYFDSNGTLNQFPRKEKQKIVILREIAKRFNPESRYSEKEVNNVLKVIYQDFVLLRRYLVEYGLLDRKSDGSKYWLKK
jgi:hypothetical protein